MKDIEIGQSWESDIQNSNYTLQFQIIVPHRLLIFGFSVGLLSPFLFGTLAS